MNIKTTYSLKGLTPLLSITFILSFLLLSSMPASAKKTTQEKYSFTFQNLEIRAILSNIEKESNYRFLYNNSLKPIKERTTLQVQNAEMAEVLELLLKNTGLTYKFMDNKLVVIKETDNNLDGQVQPVNVSGTVTDEAGKPLAGVSVSVKGTTRGTSTGEDGKFFISVDNAGAVLVFSYIGFTTQEIAVSKGTTLTVKMVAASGLLDQVVVIGYGTAAKRDLTGSIVKVEGKQIADKPNTNPVASLQGRVAGLSVTPYGTPGKAPDIRIRGTGSTNGDAVRPLYVVDGILNDNIDYINPNDIETIEILKDPSSLAIFGIRGAGGVIAITTKRAKAGQVVVNVNSTWGYKKLVDKIDVLTDGEQFKMLYEEEKANIGSSEVFDYSKWQNNTDWIDALTQTGKFTTNNVSVTASSEKNRFYMGFGYTKDEGIVKHEKLEKFQLSVADEVKLNKNIKLGFNIAGTRTKYPNDGTGALQDARRIAPIVSAGTTPYKLKLYGDSAMYNLYSVLPGIQNTLQNPLLTRENTWNKYIGRETRIVGSFYIDINLLKNLNFRSTTYGDMSWVNSTTYSPLYAGYNPVTAAAQIINPITRVNVSEDRYNKYQQDYILTYKKSIGNHNLTATAGFTTYFFGVNQLSANARQSLTGDPIPDNEAFWVINSGFNDLLANQSASYKAERATASGLFRLLYNYKSKYLLNVSYRRDGSSTFYKNGNTWENFWAIGAAWEISREDFMANQKFFDYLKVKASFGVLGGQNTYGYDYPLYPRIGAGNSAVFGNSTFPAYLNDYTPDPSLTWEKNHAKEVGVEFNSFQNRLHVELNYYDRQTKGALAFLYLPNGKPQLGNYGDISNKGFEALASWNQKINNDLSVSVSANITTFKNEVKAFGTFLAASESAPNQTEVGYPIGYFYGYIVEGIYQSYADKLASPKVIGYEYGPGDLKYRDVNGDGVIDTKDRTQIGNPTPKFMYGTSININYKRFELALDFNGSYGADVYRVWGSSELPYSRYNYASFKLNRWHGAGTSNWVPILGDNHAINRLPSTFGIEDGSYFRIRNVQIAYNFSPSILNKYSIKNLRVFANIQNLKTYKNNSGYTPEFGGSPTAFGLDYGDGPVPMIVTGGINITF